MCAFFLTLTLASGTCLHCAAINTTSNTPNVFSVPVILCFVGLLMIREEIIDKIYASVARTMGQVRRRQVTSFPVYYCPVLYGTSMSIFPFQLSGTGLLSNQSVALT